MSKDSLSGSIIDMLGKLFNFYRILLPQKGTGVPTLTIAIFISFTSVRIVKMFTGPSS